MEVDNGRKQTSTTLGFNYDVSASVKLKVDLQSIDIDPADVFEAEEHVGEETGESEHEPAESAEEDHGAEEAEHGSVAAGLFFEGTPDDDRVNAETRFKGIIVTRIACLVGKRKQCRRINIALGLVG